MAKISIVGWYGEQNVGDESFREVFTKAWGSLHQLTFSQRPDLFADYIVYGGGGVIGGRYLDSLPRDRAAFAVGVDIPLNGEQWDRLCQYNFQKIFTRSREYAAIAREQGMTCVEYCPDIAFALANPNYINKSPLKHKLGVVVSSDLKPHSRTEMARALDRLSYIYEICFYSFYNGAKEPDSRVALEVAQQMKQPSTITELIDAHHAMTVFGELNQLITMRFHGAIFATCSGTPFISLAAPGKHSLYLEQEWMKAAFMDLRDFTAYKLIALVGNAMDSEDLPVIAHQNMLSVNKVLASLL